MAGEFTGYYTYEDSGINRRLKGIYGTQAAADDVALLDSAVSAYSGSTEFPNGIAIGWIYDTGTSAWRASDTVDLSDVDQVKFAAHHMMDVFDGALVFIDANRFVWEQLFILNAMDGIYHMIVNTARVCLNSTRTVAYRQKFCEEAASWPSGLGGDVRRYIDAVGTNVPTYCMGLG